MKVKDVWVQERRYVVCINEEEVEHDRAAREAIVVGLREQLKRIEEGLDPINVVREPSANHRIPTNAWNTVLSPAEAASVEPRLP